MKSSGKYVIFAEWFDSSGERFFNPCQDYNIKNVKYLTLLESTKYATVFKSHNDCEILIKETLDKRKIMSPDEKIPVKYIILRIGSKHLPVSKIKKERKDSIEIHPHSIE